jgi:arginine/lysine/ornithine decarboxylase
VWAKTDMAFSFLSSYLSVKKLKELLPDLYEFKIERYDLPNIKSLNFYIHDILEDGISSNNRKDGQAKSLGEYLRAKYIEVPKILKKEIKNG